MACTATRRCSTPPHALLRVDMQRQQQRSQILQPLQMTKQQLEHQEQQQRLPQQHRRSRPIGCVERLIAYENDRQLCDIADVKRTAKGNTENEPAPEPCYSTGTCGSNAVASAVTESAVQSDSNSKEAVQIVEMAATHVELAIKTAQELCSRRNVTSVSRRASDGSKRSDCALVTHGAGQIGDSGTPLVSRSSKGCGLARRDRMTDATDRSRSLIVIGHQRSVSPMSPNSGFEQAVGRGAPESGGVQKSVAVRGARSCRPVTVSPIGRLSRDAGVGCKAGSLLLRPPRPSTESHACVNEVSVGESDVPCGHSKGASRRSTVHFSRSPRSRAPFVPDCNGVLPQPLPLPRRLKKGEDSPEGVVARSPPADTSSIVNQLMSPRQNAVSRAMRTPPATPTSASRRLLRRSSSNPATSSTDASLCVQQQAVPRVTTQVAADRSPSAAHRSPSFRSGPRHGEPPSVAESLTVPSEQLAVPSDDKTRLSQQRVKRIHLEWLEDVLRPRARVNPTSGTSDRRNARMQAGIEEEASVLFEDITFDEALGAGSFGAVWKGTCRAQVVAIKQCRVGDRKEATILLEEIRQLQQLRHPRLVSFLGHCDRPPHVVLLMEYMPGGSLHALLFGSSRRCVTFAVKLRMAGQVAEGLTYLHSLAVVHRDLKTMNIVLDAELNCKICDFGLTVTLERTHLTVVSLQGSPRYMAPEQFEAKAKITEKVDIWQIGCVMLELFCLSLPFSHCSNMAQIATELLIRQRSPSVPSEADPSVRALITACLRLKPQARPAAAAIEEALGGVIKLSNDGGC
eukprot:TRINITY_DN21889_c0_g3_i1.p1 TRINITY_DN21889_c0_g3~~TRINITY_DN21889_c0_g3_i1.p1  ORF type:complete len:797 (-),score=102.35 TRINITY_DN21889_c0_g3_i1:491-2881(-)